MWEDTSKLLGMSEPLTESYMKLIPAIMVHELAEKALDNVEGKLEDAAMEIPNVGIVTVRRVGKDYSYGFIPCESFSNMVEKTIRTGKSPLEKILERTLIDRLNKKYRGII